MASTPQFEHRIMIPHNKTQSIKISEIREWLNNHIGEQTVDWNWFIDKNGAEDSVVITFKKKENCTLFVLKVGL